MAKMPVIFVGHGSPMNAIEKNKHTEKWIELGKTLPRPKAILSISAHWFTEGTRVNDTDQPRLIYDMYGFPEALYRVTYPAPGAKDAAHRVRALAGPDVTVDNGWGLDHGTWSVLTRMFPAADIPVFQLSVDRNAEPAARCALGRRLRPLRDEGVLILGSGNVVHNLSRVGWEMEGGYPWAEEFDGYIREKILARRDEDVVAYQNAGASARLSVPTIDHFAPLLYVLGAAESSDEVSAFNADCVMGSLSMTGYLFRG